MNCEACNKEGEEESMIYMVANDCYVCNQECLDRLRIEIDGMRKGEHK